MRLLQFRIRSHPFLSDSSWCAIRRGINLLALESNQESRAALEFLATIRPFQQNALDYLASGANLHYHQGAMTRQIISSKKTAALAIFSSDKSLIKAMSTFDESLFEITRTEIGRRLDQSRWINFIEIASSARWSEVKPLISRLLKDLAPQGPDYQCSLLEEYIAILQDTDRLRRGLDEQILAIMHQIKASIDGPIAETFSAAMHLIEKNKRFLRAKEQAFTMLPAMPFYTFRQVKNKGQWYASVEKKIDGSITDLLLKLDKKSVLLLDLTEAGQDHILSLATLLPTLPCKQSIVAVRRHHLNLFSGKRHVIVPATESQ